MRSTREVVHCIRSELAANRPEPGKVAAVVEAVLVVCRVVAGAFGAVAGPVAALEGVAVEQVQEHLVHLDPP